MIKEKLFIFTTSSVTADELRKEGLPEVGKTSEGWYFINDKTKKINFSDKEQMIFTNNFYA